MRGLLTAGVVWLAACDPLVTGHDDSSDPDPRCPLPCDARCADDCLPSGMCARMTVPFHVDPLGPGDRRSFDVPGLPPGAEIRFDAFLGVDVVGRAEPRPSAVRLALSVNGQDARSILREDESWPWWVHWSGILTTTTNGVAHVFLDVEHADVAGVDVTCSIDAASTMTFELVNTLPWMEAPPCGG